LIPTSQIAALGHKVSKTQFVSDRFALPMQAQSLKGAKVLKGTKSHRTLPELSPKSTMGKYQPGEPPPYKKRANNSK
jgi:hypothetical protein